MLTFVDITERRRTEERLRAIGGPAQRDRRTIRRGHRQHGARGTVTFANQKLADLLGYDAPTLLGQSLVDLVAANERDNIFDAVRQAGRRRRALPDGHTADREDRADDLGQPDRRRRSATQPARSSSAVVVLVDVSETRRARSGLRLSDDRLRLVVESVKDYFILTIDQRWLPRRLDGRRGPRLRLHRRGSDRPACLADVHRGGPQGRRA